MVMIVWNKNTDIFLRNLTVIQEPNDSVRFIGKSWRQPVAHNGVFDLANGRLEGQVTVQLGADEFNLTGQLYLRKLRVEALRLAEKINRGCSQRTYEQEVLGIKRRLQCTDEDITAVLYQVETPMDKVRKTLFTENPLLPAVKRRELPESVAGMDAEVIDTRKTEEHDLLPCIEILEDQGSTERLPLWKRPEEPLLSSESNSGDATPEMIEEIPKG
jgi:hypothetical protein